MSRSRGDARRWVRQGTQLFGEALEGLDDHQLTAPSHLPLWRCSHVVAHVVANAGAIGNLLHWAATGERRPMYSSPEQRDRDIERGSRQSRDHLVADFETSATALEQAMGSLTDSQWDAQVVTAQGRLVAASETPWMRAREVMVHAVDLGTSITFRQLPTDFLRALVLDIVTKRSRSTTANSTEPALFLETTDTLERWSIPGFGPAITVSGPLADVASYLAGRGSKGVKVCGDGAVPPLPPWL